MADSDISNKKTEDSDSPVLLQPTDNEEHILSIKSDKTRFLKGFGVVIGVILIIYIIISFFNYINFVFIGPQTPDFISYLNKKYGTDKEFYLTDERGSWFSPTDYIKCFSSNKLDGQSFCVKAEKDEWQIKYTDTYFSLKYSGEINDYLQKTYASPFNNIVPGRTTTSASISYTPFYDEEHNDVSLDEYINDMNSYVDNSDRYSSSPILVTIYLDYSDYSVDSFHNINYNDIVSAKFRVLKTIDRHISPEFVFILKDDKMTGVCPEGFKNADYRRDEKMDNTLIMCER